MSRSKTLFSCGAIAFALCAGSLCQPALAIVTPAPVLTVGIDGVDHVLTGWTWNPVEDQWELPWSQWSVGDSSGNGGSVNYSGAFVFDPQLTYTFGVTDFGAPSTFTFAMSMPIAPTGPSTTVDASIVGGLTDSTGNGVSLTPNPANGDFDGDGPVEAQVAQLGLGAVPNVNMGTDVGLAVSFPATGTPGAFYSYGSYAAGPQPGPVGVWNSLGVTLSFTLSGGNDAAALTGFARVVPEPSSIVLVAIGALALAVVGRRRIKA